MKIIDPSWNHIDVFKPRLYSRIIMLFEGREYLTYVSEHDLENNHVSVYNEASRCKLCGKLWRYYEDN